VVTTPESYAARLEIAAVAGPSAVHRRIEPHVSGFAGTSSDGLAQLLRITTDFGWAPVTALMADQLGMTGAALYTTHIRPAADFIVSHWRSARSTRPSTPISAFPLVFGRSAMPERSRLSRPGFAHGRQGWPTCRDD
jgi:hypothetical protein